MSPETLGWGIIGAGDIADRITAPALRAARGSRLLAVFRRDRRRAEEFAARHGAARAYDRVEDLLADPEVGAVYVATPVARHRPDTLAAAAARKHVLCEKPLALGVAEATAMRDACARAGVALMTCFYQRFNARHRNVKELLAEGAVGRATLVRMNFSGRFPDRPGAWRQDPDIAGGGSYMDNASHCVDLLRYLFGEVTEVAAFTDTLAARYAVEDTASSLLRLRGGAHAVVTSCWSTGDPDEARNSMLEIHGTEGVILSAPLHDKFSRGTLRVVTATRDESFTFEASTHVALLEEFAAAVREGRAPAVTGDDGIAALRIVEAVYESSRARRAVTLE
jgi:1,5-anhydro-D-fructose reductase (1,5-anhydro-D-mannitol-forming)